MKPKSFLLGICLLGFVAAKAAGTDPDPNPTNSNIGKKNDLVGFVSHADNKKPIKDVNVTAYLVSKKEKAVTTDEAGIYTFDELKPGTYKFVFEKAGFKRVTKEKVVVKADESFQLNIEMIESNDFSIGPSPLHFTDF